MPSEEDKKKNLPLQFKSVKELREGQVAFIRGSSRRERERMTERRVEGMAGVSYRVSLDDIGLHRIENSGDSCMVSLHLYSPPFAECMCSA